MFLFNDGKWNGDKWNDGKWNGNEWNDASFYPYWIWIWI